jgi:dihydrofolate reductase
MEGSGQRWVVVSSTLKPEEHADVTILGEDVLQAVADLKAQPGKDIWLMGGGVLFRSLLDAGLVDGMDLTVMPVMLGSGTPVLQEGQRRSLHLEQSKALPSGILMLNYSVVPEKART